MKTSSFLENSFWVTFRYAAAAITGLVLSLIFTHFSTKTIFGQYQTVLALLGLFSLFTLPGLNTAALKAVTRNHYSAVLTAIRLSFYGSLVAIPFLLAYAYYLYSHGQTTLAETVAVASLFFPFFYAPNTWYVFYEGQSLFRPVAIRTIITSLFITTAVAVGVITHVSMFWLVTIYLSASAITTGLLYLETYYRIQHTVEPKESQFDIKYGIRVSGQKFAYSLSESLPPLSIGFFLGNEAVATFQTAIFFLGAVTGLIGALAAITTPQFFRDTQSAHKNILKQQLGIGILGSLGYWILVRLLFHRLYGDNYYDSYLLALSLGWLPLVSALKTFFVNYFTAQSKNGLIIASYCVANGLAFTLLALTAHTASFVISASIYYYSLNTVLIALFGWQYARSTQRVV